MERLSYREEILQRYARSVETSKRLGRKPLTKGQFMAIAQPGVYQDEASAGRAFRKLESGETSGERMYARREFVTHRYRVTRRGGKPIYREQFERKRGGYREGLFKVILTIEEPDENGNPQLVNLSFTAESDRLTSNYDMPEIYALMEDVVNDYFDFWMDTSYLSEDAQLISYEVIPIESSQLPSERRQQIDRLIVE